MVAGKCELSRPNPKYLSSSLSEFCLNPHRRGGLSSAGRTGAVVVVVIIVLAGIYFATTSLKGNQSTTTIQEIGRISTFGSGGGDQTSCLLQLLGYFSQMQVQETSNTLALQ